MPEDKTYLADEGSTLTLNSKYGSLSSSLYVVPITTKCFILFFSFLSFFSADARLVSGPRQIIVK